MGPLLLGLAVLIICIFLLRGVVSADPKFLVKGLRYLGVALLAAVTVFLAVTERWAPAIFLAGIGWSLFTGGHVLPGGWAGGPPSKDQTTRVRTDWLEMELAHDSGEMRGTILKGQYAGRALADLARDALLAFHHEAGDAETARLLEAYLDRRLGPDWRQAPGAETRAPRNGNAAMSRDEALKVLGLNANPSEADIRAAHRRLMMQNHPDKGGSDYLASKINEAKDVLLGA